MTDPPDDPLLAEPIFARMIAAGSRDTGLYQSYASCLAALGKRTKAVDILNRAAAIDPRDPRTWRLLGDQLFALGRSEEADAAYARHILEAVHDPVLREAALALSENRLDIAERLLKGHLKQAPTDVSAIRMLAELAGRIGRMADAETLLRRALELSPGFNAARFNLATILHRQNRSAEALREIDRLLEEEPDNPAYRNLNGAALARIGAYGDAITQFEAVLRERPDHAKIWMSYGHALKTVGRQADSIAAYRRSLSLEPTLGETWWSLANLKTVRLAETDLGAMEAALDSPAAGIDDRLHLHFALGKAEEDAGRYALSFSHYAEGNRLRADQLRYDPDVTSEHVRRSVALFTPGFIAERADAGCPAADPIFILGMPRSGSTLVEQILASHSLVEGTSELPNIDILSRLLRTESGGYPDALAQLPAERLADLGARYIEDTRIHRKSDAPFFIDKMPNNWMHAGFIRLILPHARIIDTRRGALACCLSNFKQHYARGQAFSYALDHIGRYFADYVALMDHMDPLLAGSVHRIRHEDMVEDSEREIRCLLDFLGLPFDPACLRFWENERAVQTASSEQVRRPIFRDGIDRWQDYAWHLGPLRAALGALAE